jgi:hypothetical protein
MQLLYRMGAFALIALLVACGGKGGDDEAPPAAAATPVVPVASTLEFPLRAANAVLALRGEPAVALYARGTADSPSTLGMCSGTLVLTATSINYPQLFAGAMRQFSINTVKTNYSNCVPGISDSQVFTYYDDSYLMLGSVGTGIYSEWPVPAAFPVAVTVGMSGAIGTEWLYTDSTKLTSLGKIEYSYVVEPDTATSAIVNLTARRFDAADQLLHTIQQRRRIRQDTFFEMVSWEKQDATPPGMHVIFRR